MIRTLLAAALATAIATPAAMAVTVQNDDGQPASLTFMPKHGKKLHVTLRQHHYKSFDCSMGGTVKFGKDTMECSATTARIVIKGGKLAI